MRKELVVALVALALGSGSRSFAGDGYVGIYADSAATQPCVAIPPYTAKTLYVVAVTDGGSALGITGAEFRVDVGNANGWILRYIPPANCSVALGSPIDTNPGDSTDASGVNVAFASCQPPATNGLIPLGTIWTYNNGGAATQLTVKRHGKPPNPQYPCPLFVLCDSTLAKNCMSASSGDTCTVGAAKGTVLLSTEPVAFVGSINSTFANLEPMWTMSIAGDSVELGNISIIRNGFEERPRTFFPVNFIRIGNPLSRSYDTAEGPVIGYLGVSVFAVEIDRDGTVRSTSGPIPQYAIDGGFDQPVSVLIGDEFSSRLRTLNLERLQPPQDVPRDCGLYVAPNKEIYVLVSTNGMIIRRHLDNRILGQFTVRARPPQFADGVRRFITTINTHGEQSLAIFDYDGRQVHQVPYGQARLKAEIVGDGRTACVALDYGHAKGKEEYAVDLISGVSTALPTPRSGHQRSYSRDRRYMLEIENEVRGAWLRYYDVLNCSAPTLLWEWRETSPIMESAVSASGSALAYRRLKPGNKHGVGDLFILSRAGNPVGQYIETSGSRIRGLQFVGDTYLFDGSQKLLYTNMVPTTKVHLFRLPEGS